MYHNLSFYSQSEAINPLPYMIVHVHEKIQLLLVKLEFNSPRTGIIVHFALS